MASPLAAHHRALGDLVELRRVTNLSALDEAACRRVEPGSDAPHWDRLYASAICERTHPRVERVAALCPGCELSWERWQVAQGSPRRLADRRVSLPRFGGDGP
jgi:hypothetical protein